MADTIKIGSLDISAFKVGSSDCKIYLGDTLLYPQSPTPPTPTLKWVSYSEGDAIPREDVYKIYGFKIPTQTFYNIIENGNYFEIYFNSEEKDQQFHSVSIIGLTFYSEGLFFTINEQIQEISYDPESDEYLEIIFSDYGADYNYSVSYIIYGEESEPSIIYNFPFDMDLYEEHVPTLQWVAFSAGDTIPSDLEIYGVSGLASNLVSTFVMYGDNIEFTDEGRGKCSVHIGWMEYRYCYEEDGLSMSSNLEYIFSNISNSCKLDSYTVSNGVTVGGTIKLYIYA